MGVGQLATKSLVLKISMTISSQNLFNQQQPSLTPGRIITKVKRYVSPTGQVVEQRWVTITAQDNQGIFRTEDAIEVLPPLADGTTPEDSDKIRECFRCRCLIHEKNHHICPLCGLGFCLAYTIATEIEGEKVRLCVDCAKNIRHPFLQAAKRILWG
jgi:hypothetical protein